MLSNQPSPNDRATNAAFPRSRNSGPIPELASIDHLHFVCNHNLRESIPNILAIATIFRAISLERDSAPQLKLMAENALGNCMRSFGNLSEQIGKNIEGNVLLLTSASFYEREYAQLIYKYKKAGANLTDTIDLVPDEIVLGKREDPSLPVWPHVRHLVSEIEDQPLQVLIHLTQECMAGNKEESTLAEIRQSLDVLVTETFPFPFTKTAKYELIPSLKRLIVELAEGPHSSQLISELNDIYKDAFEIAKNIWYQAKEAERGIFVINEIPYSERDDNVSKCLKDLYMQDQRANFVLEFGVDRPANALSYIESLDFSRRLGLGEDATDLLKEVETIVKNRKDLGTLSDIAIADMRDRDPRQTLENILEKASYLNDPDGAYTIIKWPKNLDEYALIRKLQITPITHSSLWIHDLEKSDSRPFFIQFQAKDLRIFLSGVL